MKSKPNVIFVFGDQWRQQATGYSGNPNVKTPNLDALAAESINFTMAISGCPVCSPYRASLMTGQVPLTHGVFVNDVCLRPNHAPLADVFAREGYETAYVGKWHIDGHGRSACIPRERHLGFDYWKVLECTHDYNDSDYYAHDSDELLRWEGYDAMAQTRDVQDYIRQSCNEDKPFVLMLSWGPPHAPYGTAPEKYRKLYRPEDIQLRPNVPEESAEQARRELAGYYAHCTALDDCMGDLLCTLDECGISEDTILVFTSDHGDMLGSQGEVKKQRPWDESIRVPFLLRYPGLPGWQPRETEALINAPDIMPTLLGLCGLPCPDAVQGKDFSAHIAGGDDPSEGGGYIGCPHPFGQWNRPAYGGREYRGLRTRQYTYARSLDGPWLLYDNLKDPYQERNLIEAPEAAATIKELESTLQEKMTLYQDEFLSGMDYIRQWGYSVDETGTVPYSK